MSLGKSKVGLICLACLVLAACAIPLRTAVHRPVIAAIQVLRGKKTVAGEEMGQDPFIAGLMERYKAGHSLSAMLGNALLAGTIPFFTFEVGKLVFTWVASDQDPKFDPIMAWPVAITASFVTAGILVGAATQLGAHNRERFALCLAFLAVVLEIWK